MPQLVPFYFVNQVTGTFILLAILVYFLSKYLLPKMFSLFLTREFITKI